MPAADFIAMISSPSVLGNPLLKTQHFIGQTRWERVSDTEVIGYHQLRVPHQKYTDASMKEVAVKGHAHSANMHWYTKVDGVWKFAGLRPDIRWSEYEFEKVFESGREEMGEKNEVDVSQVKLAGEVEKMGIEKSMVQAVSV
jgi:scytalone dehydratase